MEKQKGRVERREVWSVAAGDLGPYLAQEFGWVGVASVGWVHRCRWEGDRATEQWVTWVSSVPFSATGARRMGRWLRGHWSIENGVFRVRDVSLDEDRLHARSIGLALATLRNGAMNLVRRLGYRYMPDGWSHIAARPDRGLALLLEPLKH